MNALVPVFQAICVLGTCYIGCMAGYYTAWPAARRIQRDFELWRRRPA